MEFLKNVITLVAEAVLPVKRKGKKIWMTDDILELTEQRMLGKGTEQYRLSISELKTSASKLRKNELRRSVYTQTWQISETTFMKCTEVSKSFPVEKP